MSLRETASGAEIGSPENAAFWRGFAAAKAGEKNDPPYDTAFAFACTLASYWREGYSKFDGVPDIAGDFAVVPGPGYCGNTCTIIAIYDRLPKAVAAAKARKGLVAVPVTGYSVGDDIGPWSQTDRYWRADGTCSR